MENKNLNGWDFVSEPTDFNWLLNHNGGATNTPKNQTYFKLVTLDYLIKHTHYFGETQDPESDRMHKQFGGLAYLVMRILANPPILSPKERPNPTEFIIAYDESHDRIQIDVMRYNVEKDIYEPIADINEDCYGEWVVKAHYDKATITDFLVYAGNLLVK